MVQPGDYCRCFSLDELLIATNNFDEALVVGKGGFGKVYKASIMHDDGSTTVAIKRLNAESKQGAEEFWAEVKTLSKLRHTHLVALIGYCKDSQEMILVYEYIAHGTLANHLYKISNRQESGKCISHLSWEQRLNICIGAARGLDYLHTGTEQSIIHRDVKTSNILLDLKLVAKVSDFGLSKSITTHTTTHVSTNVKGTFGYLDPDYFYTRRLTKKSDVYAFGVVLLEVLCGRPPVDPTLDEELGLCFWAQQLIKKGKLDQIVDPSLIGQITPHGLKHFAQLANKCLHIRRKERPTMSEVVGSLEIALALHKSKGRTKKMMSKLFQGIQLVPKGMNRWWRDGKDNGTTVERKGLQLLREQLFENYTQRLRHCSLADEIQATLSHGGRFIQYNIFGNFEVTAKYKPPIVPIGKGAFGIVCSALNSETNEHVAIRKIANAFDKTIDAKRTLWDIKLLRHMDHENVVAIRDIIPSPQRESFSDFYIAYELMDTDLHQIIHSNQTLSEKHCQHFLYQILRGLKYIHSANVIHRDLKPTNLLLNAIGDLKICDFGLPHVSSKTDFTTEYVVTRWYMAPEMLLYSSDYTTAIDVWSVGCIFMELMNRKPLFPGGDHLHQLHLLLQLIGTPSEAELGFLNDNAKKYLRQLPPHRRQSFTEKFPQIHPAAIDLIEKMLTFDPRRRITVEDALAHPYLMSLHDISDEPICMSPFSFDFEQHALSEEQMKELIYREALAFNPGYMHM